MADRASRTSILPGDTDYVESFQALCEINIAIRDKGPTARRLLRRAYLQIAMADHAGAARTAERLCTAIPALAEAWYVRGEAHLGLALAAAGLGVEAPLHELPPETDVHGSLEEAEDAFAMAAEFLAADLEALERLALVRRLQACDSPEAMEHALFSIDRPPRPKR